MLATPGGGQVGGPYPLALSLWGGWGELYLILYMGLANFAQVNAFSSLGLSSDEESGVGYPGGTWC